jgi:hypothetical protein
VLVEVEFNTNGGANGVDSSISGTGITTITSLVEVVVLQVMFLQKMVLMEVLEVEVRR